MCPSSHSSFVHARFFSGGLRRRRCFGSGFTLIELLVVIVIVAILAGILIPVIGKMRERAHLATSVSQLRQIGAALNLYAGDHKGTLPPPYIAMTENSNAEYWSLRLRNLGYLGESGRFLHELLVAPAVGYTNPDGSKRSEEEVYYTYSAAGTMGELTPGGWIRQNIGRRTVNIPNPSGSILVFLARDRSNHDGRCDPRHVGFNASVLPDLSAESTSGTRVLNFAYSDQMPALMADGSVRIFSFENRATEITQPMWEGK